MRSASFLLLSDWISPPDNDDDDKRASKYIRKVDVSTLEHAASDEKRDGLFSGKRQGRKNPRVV